MATNRIVELEAVHVKNCRVLSDVTPLTVLMGPNGSGKSTLFAVFALLSDCFTAGLTQAWGNCNRHRLRGSRIGTVG